MDDMVLVKLLEQEAASWDLRICPGARHPDAINRNAHAKRRADLLRSAAATIAAWNTRCASGDLNEPFGNPEQLASREQRARELLAAQVDVDAQGTPSLAIEAERIRAGVSNSAFADAALRAITAALANQQGVGGAKAECDRRGKLLADLYNCDEAQIPVALLRRISACLMGMDEAQPAGDVGSQPTSKSVARRLVVQRGEGDVGREGGLE